MEALVTECVLPMQRWNPPEDLVELGDALILDLVSVFLTNTSTYIAQMGELNPNRDFDRMKALAHKVKGGACQMGATTVTEVCQRLEEAARNASGPEVETLMAELRTSFLSICAEMTAFPGVGA